MRKLMHSRICLLALLAMLAVSTQVQAGGSREPAATPAAATEAPEAWSPARPTTIITHVGSGGGTDVAIRLMVDIAREYTDATFVVENVTGGATMNA